MKILIVLFALTLNLKAQLSSYRNNYYKVELTFTTSFQLNDKTVFMLGALEEYEIHLSFGHDLTKVESAKSGIFKMTNCVDCKLFETQKTDKPLDYIFDVIQEEDVFIIRKVDGKYVVELYRKPV